MEPEDRLDFERHLLWLRTLYLVAPAALVWLYGPAITPIAGLMVIPILAPALLTWLLLRSNPLALLRSQLALRLLDVVLTYLVLHYVYRFSGGAGADFIYVLAVVSAAATHGRDGTAVVTFGAGACLLATRLQMAADGIEPFGADAATSILLHMLLFVLAGLVVNFLVETAARATERKDKARLAETAQQNAALAAVNRELDSFAYSVSHDLRAPLRGIDGFGQALLEDCGEQLDELGHDYLDRIRGAANLAMELIEGLLMLSRVSRAAIRTETVDLSELGRTIANGLRERFPDRQVTFVGAEGLRARGDPRLLEIVLQNLLENAWKFTSKHSAATIELGAMRNHEGIVYYVRDDGAGFDMEYADKLFAPFQRLHSRADFEGTGMGLASVQRAVNRHGGQVWAEGAVEQGATFYFTLQAGTRPGPEPGLQNRPPEPVPAPTP